MLRALHSRICPQVFAIRAIALLAHTWGRQMSIAALARAHPSYIRLAYFHSKFNCPIFIREISGVVSETTIKLIPPLISPS